MEFLTGKEYDTEATTEWTKLLSDDIKTRLKGKHRDPIRTKEVLLKQLNN